jgi:hypothetical protein
MSLADLCAAGGHVEAWARLSRACATDPRAWPKVRTSTGWPA